MDHGGNSPTNSMLNSVLKRAKEFKIPKEIIDRAITKAEAAKVCVCVCVCVCARARARAVLSFKMTSIPSVHTCPTGRGHGDLRGHGPCWCFCHGAMCN